MDVKTVNDIVKNKTTTILYGLYFIDHKNDVKMFKTLQCYTTRLRFVCGLWLHLNFEHIDAISMVDKSTDHGKCRLVK